MQSEKNFTLNNLEESSNVFGKACEWVEQNNPNEKKGALKEGEI